MGISCKEAGSPPPLIVTNWFRLKTSLLKEAIETCDLFLEIRAIKLFILLGLKIVPTLF